MTRFQTLIFALLPVVSGFPYSVPVKPVHRRQQYDDPNEQRVQAIVDAFRLSWGGYYTYAFPNDELKPVNNGYSNSRYLSTAKATYIF